MSHPNDVPVAASPAAIEEPRPPRRRLGWALLGLVLVGSLLAVPALRRAWQAHGEPPVPAAPPPVAVRTALVVRESVPIVASAMGTALPIASVTVHARVDGQLERVNFKEGQDVRAGQLLAQLDPRTLAAQLQQAQAQKAKDQAQLVNAQADLRRYEDMIKDDATTRQTLDTQRALVKQLQAAQQNDDALVNAASVQLGYTSISAPISGRIGARLVDPGNIVHAADPGGLVVINQIDPIAVQFALPQGSFQAINHALQAGRGPLSVQALEGDTQEVLGNGELVLLNNQIDTSTGTISMKAHFANGQHRLWPGQSLQVRLVLGQQADALTVTAVAVQRSQAGLFVYVVDQSGKAHDQAVQVGQTYAGKTIVTQGLSAGERVVVDGQYKLKPGSVVTEAAQPPGAPAAAASAAAASGAAR